jgi:hypothetical protein
MENHPGVLAEIADQFRDLDINISSVAVAKTQDEVYSYITIVIATEVAAAAASGGNHAVGIDLVALVAGGIEGDARQRERFTLVLGKELCDEPLLAVMLVLVIQGAAVKELFAEGVQAVEPG